MNDTLYFFNNRRGSEHSKIYNHELAFYDLNTDGRHAKWAVDLPVGQECVVCGPEKVDGTIEFSWFEFIEEAVVESTATRVFLGYHLLNRSMPRTQAIEDSIYRHWFNVNGHFKRPSVLTAQVPFTERPTFAKTKNTKNYDEHSEQEAVAFPEGAVRSILTNAYERNPKARRMCIEHFGADCVVCGMSFGEVYGEFARDFIHVHHLRPLSECPPDYEVDPIADLRPVCPNCHAAIHFGGETRSINSVKRSFNRKR